MTSRFDPDRHHRRSMRLPGYDYAQAGAYFVTIVTHQRACLFGTVADGEMHLNALGAIARDEWLRTAKIRRNVIMDAFVIMPNHIHGVIIIHGGDAGDAVATPTNGATVQPNVGATPTNGATVQPNVGATPTNGATVQPNVGATRRVAPTGPEPGSVGAIVGQIKSVISKRINSLRGTPGAPVWQRNYYEHIIRDEASLNRIRQYVADNPAQWALDKENPDWQSSAGVDLKPAPTPIRRRAQDDGGNE